MKRNEKKWQEMTRNEKKWKQWTESEKKWKEMNNNKTHVVFCFKSLGFRDSGITCMSFFIVKMFLEIMCFSFLAKNANNTNNWNWENWFFSKKRKSQTCCKGVSGAMCCEQIWDCLRVASVVKAKSVLIRHSLNRLNRMK